FTCRDSLEKPGRIREALIKKKGCAFGTRKKLFLFVRGFLLVSPDSCVAAGLVRALSEESPDVTVIVKGSDLAAETDDTFVCATLDWWPPDKCNYDQCPWGQSSVLNLDLTHPFLANAIQAIITFGLNALRGRHRVHNGNELSGRGVGARVGSEQYAKDLVGLRALLKELYEDSNTQPLLVAPGGFFDQQWYAQLLQDSGLGVVNFHATLQTKELFDTIQAGISLVLINLNDATKFSVTVRNDLNVILVEGEGIRKDNSFVHGLKRTFSWVGKKASDESEKREEYHLTGKDDNHLSRTVLLNGTPLELTDDGDIPPLDPVHVPTNSPLDVAPLSVAFVVFPNFEAQACT
ncbi:hypothetical protein GW17_00036164, partial [Ensete ventricosum]